MTRIFFATLFAALLLAAPVVVFAQTPPANAAAPAESQDAASDAAAQAEPAWFESSFLFSPLEMAAILQARAGQAPGTAMLNAGSVTNIPVQRQIRVSGVVYRSSNDWIAWINGSKIVPGKLLPEIVSINVEKETVHLKWFDIGMNKIISISMRPHQTYDIVTGILLPGG